MRWVHLLLILSLVFSVSACKKKKKDIKEPVAVPTSTPVKDNNTPKTNTATNTNPTNTNTGNTNTTTTDNTSADFGAIYFEYDSPDLNAESEATLDKIAQYLEAHPSASILISGHADERGTEEYNLSLGEDRARVAKTYLVRSGVAANQIQTISYGEERPVVQGDEETSWAKNRRDEFEITKK